MTVIGCERHNHTVWSESKAGGTLTHVKSTSARFRTLVVTAISPQMEDDVEVELELEKQVSLFIFLSWADFFYCFIVHCRC